MTNDRAIRFGEASNQTLALMQALHAVALGGLTGLGISFAAILVLGIVGEEALSTFYSELDLDPLFRASMGGVLVVAAVLALAYPTMRIVVRFATLSALVEHAETQPDVVPVRAQRALVEKSPAGEVRVFGLVLAIVGGFVAGMMLIMLVTEYGMAEHIETWIAIGGGGALVFVGWRTRRAGRADGPIERYWADRSRALGAQISLVASATDRERTRRESVADEDAPAIMRVGSGRVARAINRIVLAAAVVATMTFFLSVFLRQQCRNCEPVTWDQPMENVIDVLSLLSSTVIVATAAFGILSWIAGVLLQVASERAMRSWARDGAPRGMEHSVRDTFLLGPSAAMRAGVTLGAVGSAGAVLGLGIAWSEWRGVDPGMLWTAVAAALFLGVLVVLFGEPAAVRTRNLVREATSPGDITSMGDTDAVNKRGGRGRRGARGRRRGR